ncbi:MAG: hypothetical protein JWN34_1779 [Bryobacterales bacterium]|nr:hypothetical protein [Bryobacterales bacterium]
MTRLHRFLRTNAGERRLFAYALAAMAVSRVAIVVFPLRRILAAMSAMNRRWPVLRVSPVTVQQAAKRISQAARYCPTTCLSRTLAGHFLMSRLGYPSTPRIGVSKTGGRFAAHAWLECPDNIIIGDQSPDENTYHAVPSLERFFT